VSLLFLIDHPPSLTVLAITAAIRRIANTVSEGYPQFSGNRGIRRNSHIQPHKERKGFSEWADKKIKPPTNNRGFIF